ncbi:MAG: BamA/TamA family outer membrane protein [bacterium]
MNFNNFYTIFLFLLFPFLLFSHNSLPILKSEFENYKTLKLEKVTFDSDISFNKYEFLYLVNLKVGELVSFKNIKKAYKQLMRIKRFKNVEIDFDIYSGNLDLRFKLTANWIFKTLILKGIWFDKYQYEDLYLQQPGDIFDISLHEESIHDIKNMLKDKGFFNSVVEDEFVYEAAEKLVTVKLNVDRSKCFKIESVSFDFDSEDKKDVYDSINKRFKNSFVGFYYFKKLIKEESERLSEFLRKKGYLNCEIKIKRIVKRNKSKVAIVFEVKLGKRFKIKFLGNKFYSKEYIRQNLLSSDMPSWLFSPPIIAEQLLQEYYKKGFWSTVVNYKIQEDGTIFFTINEGGRFIVDSVVLKSSVNDSLIGRSSYFNELLANKYYDEEILNDCLKNLTNFYLSIGFWDFKILQKRFVKINDRYKILIFIDKGQQRFYGGVSVKNFEYLNGDKFFQKNEPRNSLIPFNSDWISEQRTFLLKYFQKQGYWYVEVQPEFVSTVLRNNKSLVLVKWGVNSGKKVKFGKLLLQGNTKLPFKRILDELRFKQGEIWDKSKLDLTTSRFRKLDLFKKIQLQPYKVSKASEEKPIILTLVDDDPYEVRLRLGYFLTSKNFLLKRQSTYKIGSSFVFKNPTNSADKLSFNADLTRFERYLNIDYQIPSPFDLPIIAKTKAYANKYVQPVEIGKSGSAYEAIQNGFLVGLSNEYKKNYFWGCNIGNEWMETTKVRGNLDFAPELIDKTVPYFFVEPSLVIDTIDDRLNAKNGSLTFLSLKTMVPYKDAQTTFKIMIEQSFLKNIFSDVVAGLRLRWGHIFRQDFEYIMPIERFYLGGPHSVRGYEIDSIPPLGVSINIVDGKIIKEYTIQGGSCMVNANLELRFPIYKSFKGVIFQDIGVLSQTGFGGFKGTWYPGTGFGFRYKTPIGPIRFDIGWKWKKRFEHDCPYAWYLTIGEAF